VPPRPHPRIQVVHEEDVAAAILAALPASVRAGTFNLAAPEAITLPALLRNGRFWAVGIPISALELIVGGPAADGGPRSQPSGAILDLLRTSITLNCERARHELVWSPKYSAWEARAAYNQPRPVKWALIAQGAHETS
jgi:UDP-glucose 4-epimerase